MKGFNVKPSAVTYGILIKAFGFSNKLERAFQIFEEMKRNSLLPNSITYGCLLDACVKNGDIKRASNVFDQMMRDGIAFNTVIYTTMIKGYSKEWQLEKAYQLYLRMLSEMEFNPAVAPNTITYNSILDCCVRCFDMPRAISIFSKMRTN